LLLNLIPPRAGCGHSGIGQSAFGFVDQNRRVMVRRADPTKRTISRSERRL
jgi:hypothetical protein